MYSPQEAALSPDPGTEYRNQQKDQCNSSMESKTWAQHIKFNRPNNQFIHSFIIHQLFQQNFKNGRKVEIRILEAPYLGLMLDAFVNT